MDRRRLFASGAVAAAGVATLAAPNLASAQPRIRWRCPGSFPKSLDTLWGTHEFITRRVSEMTDGAFQITPFGPVLDVVPYVAADGYTIELTMIPTFSEFIGYDDPGLFIPQVQGAAGSSIGLPLVAQLPLPRLRVRQVVTTAIVWDGQTVVLGGLIQEDIRKHRDKVPFLGDIPFLGRLFRSESTAAEKKNLVIFITPTIIDPAGNPIHTPDNLPFDPTVLPDKAKKVQ